MAKGEQHSNKMTKKPKKDTSPPKTSTSDRPNPPTTYVAPRGKIKNKYVSLAHDPCVFRRAHARS